MNANVDVNDDKSVENISICKLNFPSDIQENVKKEKQDVLTRYLRDLLKGVLRKTKHDVAEDTDIISFKIRNTKRLMKGETDVNHGALHIYVWKDKESQEVKSYSIIRSKLSGAWQKVTGIRDLGFPFKFAEAFLKESEMNNIKLNYLRGRSIASSTLRTSSVHFDPHEIIENYGVVKEFTSPLKNNILKKFVAEDYVRIQIGQIKLQIHRDRDLNFEPNEYISMIKIIDERLSAQANPWKVLNYICLVDFKLRKELRENISKQLAAYIKRPDEQYSFEAETTLQHPYESFYASEKELIFERKTIKKWGREYPVTIKMVLNAARGELREGDKCFEDIQKLSIKFYDPVLCGKKTESFVSLVQDMQILHTKTGKNTYFQHHKCLYSLEQETFLETNVRFVNIVKNCLVNEEAKLPKILQWSCHFETKPKPPTFTEKEIYDFVKVNADESECEESCKKLIRILSEEYSLFESNGENDFASSNRNVVFNTQHSEKLLDLNSSILEKSPLGKYFIKSSSENKTSTLQRFSKLLAKAPDMDTIMLELKEKQDLDNEKLVKVKDDLLRKQRCIVRAKETATRYKVNSPYITKSLLTKLKKLNLNVCPVKLLQFLRMCFFQLQEGEYNELYHLSNCECEVKNSWKYVVGDRIFSNENKNVELFDVMALNTEDQEVYLIHVKKGFGASASRELSSQVSTCGDQIWKSLSINSKTNMLKMFFKVATTVTSDDSIHRVLTKQEVENIGETEIQFLDVMKSTKMKYFICFSPCTTKTRKFSSLLQTNLDYEFVKNDFKDIDMIEKLQKAGILNEHKITADIFKPKKNLQKEHSFLKDSVYSKLISSIGGINTRDFLSDNSSFVAKVTLIDLYRKFSTFIFNGKQQLKLKILEIPSFEEKNKQKHITECFTKSKNLQTAINLKSEPNIKNE